MADKAIDTPGEVTKMCHEANTRVHRMWSLYRLQLGCPSSSAVVFQLSISYVCQGNQPARINSEADRASFCSSTVVVAVLHVLGHARTKISCCVAMLQRANVCLGFKLNTFKPRSFPNRRHWSNRSKQLDCPYQHIRIHPPTLSVPNRRHRTHPWISVDIVFDQIDDHWG